MSLAGKVIFITGASRGIGLAIAERAAKDGAKIAIAAKTTTPHPKLPGTIYSAAESLEKIGGEALPLPCDIRDEDQVIAAMASTVQKFGGIDILVNNASAISLSPTLETEMKRYDLMHAVNGRGTFLCSKTALPHLLEAQNPHILTISPPLNLSPRWFAPHLAYTTAKYEMSLCTLGLASEYRGKIAVNSLWPATAIATAAVANLLGGEEALAASRSPRIMADAAWQILQMDIKISGNFFIDEEVLAQHGERDFEKYAVKPGAKLLRDFFLD